MKTDSNEEMICGLNAISQIIKTRPKSVKALFVINSPNERLKELIKLTEDLIKILRESIIKMLL
jgi:tRNA G18 (ribose-2'-O)-methylase SpoU